MGSRLVKDINPSGSSSPNELISANGFLFFSAELGQNSSNDNDNNSESGGNTENGVRTTSDNGNVGLIRSDGTDEGTVVLRSFDSVTNLVNASGELYFIAGQNNQYQQL